MRCPTCNVDAGGYRWFRKIRGGFFRLCSTCYVIVTKEHADALRKREAEIHRLKVELDAAQDTALDVLHRSGDR